eukprot:2125110-Pleurochrysis_carterae.AAC.3
MVAALLRGSACTASAPSGALTNGLWLLHLLVQCGILARRLTTYSERPSAAGLHSKVSDNASNMAKGWIGFDAGGLCADHTLELSVKASASADGVVDTLTRAKGIVGYFHRSTVGIQDLTSVQRAQHKLPEKKLILDVRTRWVSSYMMLDWLREQQSAVQMYDIKHSAEACKKDAYKDNQLQLADWSVIEQSVAVLMASAQATKFLEGTKYASAQQQWLRATQIDPEVRAARRLLHDDLERRWLIELPDTQRAELDIATLLDLQRV